MKKFLSVSVCLMLCLASLLMISGCKAKPKPVSEEQANVVLETAMINLETSSAIKMASDNLFFMGPCIIIMSEEIEYSNMFGMPSWMKKEDGVWYEYLIMEMEIDNEPVTQYTKTLVIDEEEDSSDDMLSMVFEDFEDFKFSSASLLDEEYSIDFTMIDDGVTIKMTFVIENDMIEEIRYSFLGESFAIEFEFGQDAIEDIPQIPTDVTWEEENPYIRVVGMPTEFVVGGTLDLTDVVIEFYENDFTLISDDYDINMTMISGFDTTTAGTRTMTVTFYGLTYDIEYTVTEAAAE